MERSVVGFGVPNGDAERQSDGDRRGHGPSDPHRRLRAWHRFHDRVSTFIFFGCIRAPHQRVAITLDGPAAESDVSGVRENLVEVGNLDRLYKMCVAPSRARQRTVAFLTPTGYGDDDDRIAPGLLANSTGRGMPVELGQPNIHEDDFGPER